MSYENAPATRMIATSCCACGRPLVDSASVESGMGPDCRKKYGYYDAIPQELRVEANQIIHTIALNRHAETVPALINKINEMGLKRLAAKLSEAIVTITVEEKDGRLVVTTPYDDAVVAAMRSVPGRRWDREAKSNSFPTSSRAALWALFRRFYLGKVGMGPKGMFVVGAAQSSPISTQVREEAEIYGVSTSQVEEWKRNMMDGKCPDGCCGGES